MRPRKVWGRSLAGLLALLFCTFAAVYSSAKTQSGTPNQDIPDAPSAVRPPQPEPAAPVPAATPDHPAENPAPTEPPPNQNSDQGGGPDARGTNPEAPPPMPGVKTVPPGGETQAKSSGQDELYKFAITTNEVIVPVRVTDGSNARIDGLLPKDFSVYEDGKKQTMNFFTSDPVAISAAVIIDLGLPDVAIQRVNQTFPALESAFSQFDEVSLYMYSSAVSRQTSFGSASKQLTARLNELKTVRGRNNGPPVMGGPLGPQGPTINNRPVDPNVPAAITPPRESHVLNDAILLAALDLSRRKKERRKIIFIITDGREYRSNASYRDVLKVLLSQGIAVYAVAVESSAIPGYNKLERIHLPGFGYSDILPKYSNATAGEIFTDFSRTAIEASYARAMSEARNEYTLGYLTRATPSNAYRQVEVRVALPDVKVYARDGYYPAPPAAR
ncbi:MAG: VWA domain-containing protein [Terriglobales bacterium]